jgi:hypothetical protein
MPPCPVLCGDNFVRRFYQAMQRNEHSLLTSTIDAAGRLNGVKWMRNSDEGVLLKGRKKLP